MKPVLFEVCFEIANFVGGIHTVVSTKIAEVQSHIPHHILIGPYFENAARRQFKEAKKPEVLRNIAQELQQHNIRIHYGTWLVEGKPKCILIDFKHAHCNVDELKTTLYQQFGIESHDAGYEVDEPITFSFATAKFIQAYEKALPKNSIPIVQTHEWMTGYTNLLLKSIGSNAKTVFTTHATMLGRTLHSRKFDFTKDVSKEQLRELAIQSNILAKHSAEIGCATHSNVFTTVSDVTASECEKLLGIKPQVITYNGINLNALYPLTQLPKMAKKARKQLERVAKIALSNSYDKHKQTQFWVTSGRHEPKNKGYDIIIKAAKEIQAKTNQQIILYILVPFEEFGVNEELKERMEGILKPTYQMRDLVYHTRNELTELLDELSFFNQETDSVKILYVPQYIFSGNELFGMEYESLLPGFDLGLFPSFYEPWGYTPHEAIAAGVSTITSNTAGFGKYIAQYQKGEEIVIIPRNHDDEPRTITKLANHLLIKAKRSKDQIDTESACARLITKHCTWKTFMDNYLKAYTLATKNKIVFKKTN